jgi:hypothetical protein
MKISTSDPINFTHDRMSPKHAEATLKKVPESIKKIIFIQKIFELN